MTKTLFCLASVATLMILFTPKVFFITSVLPPRRSGEHGD
jgi:hypothetical protein